jgi:hypothetical protein
MSFPGMFPFPELRRLQGLVPMRDYIWREIRRFHLSADFPIKLQPPAHLHDLLVVREREEPL